MVVGDEGARLENLVAVSLLKHLNWIEDSKGQRCALRNLRTKDGREVDFALVIDDVPELIVEVKLSDPTLSPSLRYFHEKYSFKAVQVVKNLATERQIQTVALRRATSFLKELAM